MPGDLARGVRHAMPAQAERIAVGFHHPRDNYDVQQRTCQGGIDHGPDAEAAAEEQRAGEDRDGDDCRRQSGKGEAIEGVENRSAVGGDAGEQDDGQQAVEEVDGKRELGGREVGGDERKEAVREKGHQSGRDAEKQAHPEHGTREQLLGAIAALLFPHPDERGHESLVHGF